MHIRDRCLLAMKFSRLIIGVLFLCGVLFSSHGAEAKRVGDVIRVGIWDGYKYIDDGTGKFSHCIMGAQFKSGITVFFSVNRRYDISVGFYNPSWDLQTDSIYPVKLSVDRTISQNTNATANSKKTIRIILQNKNAWYAAFRKGRRMQLDAAKGKFRFRLVGTYVALPRILDCVDQALSTERKNGEKNPFAQNSANPFKSNNKQRVASPKMKPKAKTSSKSRQSMKSTQVFSTKHMESILSSSGLEGFRVLKKKEREKLSSTATHAWFNANLVGFLIMSREDKSETIEKMSTAYVSKVSGNCTGKFASGAMESVNLGKEKYRRVSAKCQTNSRSDIYYLTFFLGESKDKKSMLGTTLMHTGEEIHDEEIGMADKKLREFFVEIFSK